MMGAMGSSDRPGPMGRSSPSQIGGRRRDGSRTTTAAAAAGAQASGLSGPITAPKPTATTDLFMSVRKPIDDMKAKFRRERVTALGGIAGPASNGKKTALGV